MQGSALCVVFLGTKSLSDFKGKDKNTLSISSGGGWSCLQGQMPSSGRSVSFPVSPKYFRQQDSALHTTLSSLSYSFFCTNISKDQNLSAAHPGPSVAVKLWLLSNVQMGGWNGVLFITYIHKIMFTLTFNKKNQNNFPNRNGKQHSFSDTFCSSFRFKPGPNGHAYYSPVANEEAVSQARDVNWSDSLCFTRLVCFS